MFRRRVGSAIPAAAASRFRTLKATGPSPSWRRRKSSASATADRSSRLSVETASNASAVCGEPVSSHAIDGAPLPATAIEKVSESAFRAGFAFVLASTVRRSSSGSGARISPLRTAPMMPMLPPPRYSGSPPRGFVQVANDEHGRPRPSGQVHQRTQGVADVLGLGELTESGM